MYTYRSLRRRVRGAGHILRPWRACSVRVRRFLVDTRAGATAIAAAAVTAMVVGGVGLLIDHNWLVSKRDLLKHAADSAAMAATLALQDLSPSASDEAVKARLQPVAERYAQLNVLGNIRDANLTAQDISVTLDIDRSAGTVGATVEADIGHVLAGWLHRYRGPGRMQGDAGFEQAGLPLALVLAVDLSASMQAPIGTDGASRIEATREAVKILITAVDPNAREPTMVGLVGWSYDVHTNDVQELTTSASIARSAMESFEADGGPTYSASGVNRAKTMLDPVSDDLHKAIVLLTDGEDNMRYDDDGNRVNYCPHKLDENGNRGPELACRLPRREACTAAKNAGIEIFVVAAMHPEKVSGSLAHELRLCATADDESHVFINNTDAAVLEAAFETISRKLTPLQRTH